MKNFIKSSIFLLTLCWVGISCQKDNLTKQNLPSFTKDEILNIYTTYSDEDINSLKVNLDKLIQSNFTFSEREDLILERVQNIQKNGLEKIMKKFFDAFRQDYNKSYLGGNFVEREKFAKEYLRVLKEE